MSDPQPPEPGRSEDPGYGAQQPPYGQPPQYGQNPYGQQPPYGQSPYGTPVPTDSVSITSFVLSLTCCLSLIGLILGIVGLRRTKDGVRKGRWAAVAGTVIGALGTLVAAAVVFGVVFLVQNSVSPGNAEVGQCVDVTVADDGVGDDDAAGDVTTLQERDCTEEHDAEVVAVGTASDVAGGLSRDSDAGDVCTSAMAEADFAVLQEALPQFRLTLLVDDPDDIGADDSFLCFVEPLSGTLDDAILG